MHVASKSAQKNPYGADVRTLFIVMIINGGHYNTEESVFNCPLNGTYFFIFSLTHEALLNLFLPN